MAPDSRSFAYRLKRHLGLWLASKSTPPGTGDPSNHCKPHGLNGYKKGSQDNGPTEKHADVSATVLRRQALWIIASVMPISAVVCHSV